MADKKEKAVVEETTAASIENVEVTAEQVEVAEATAEATETEEKAVEKVIFESADGNKYEVLTAKILFRGERLVSEKAVTENKDVLEHLVGLNSFILKKI